ncbi:DUF2637 domain-containing protein [Streptomyces sp. KLOTTS4A1]|uniref:DUF2637 domain-containing protein n=1 Tax=Streptomyces sp. KLOTTS4A1 TaxID=3390996 RepID=UPI0039F5B2C0
MSFTHLHDIAEAAGQHGWKAWACPVSVDLLLVAAWRRLRQGRTPRLAWCWFLIALFASLGANVATAGFLDLEHAPAWLRFLVAGWPALAFLGGTLLAHGTDPEPERETAVPAESTTPAEPVAMPSQTAVDVPERAPELPPAAPAVNVPPALVEHARKVADAHRARTGTPIDPDTLRIQLGVPAPMATAIAAQLT